MIYIEHWSSNQTYIYHYRVRVRREAVIPPDNARQSPVNVYRPKSVHRGLPLPTVFGETLIMASREELLTIIYASPIRFGMQSVYFELPKNTLSCVLFILRNAIFSTIIIMICVVSDENPPER